MYPPLLYDWIGFPDVASTVLYFVQGFQTSGQGQQGLDELGLCVLVQWLKPGVDWENLALQAQQTNTESYAL